MSDSTRRALRTVYHGIVAAAVVIPLIAAPLSGTPWEAKAAVAVAVLGVVSKILNGLEDAGLIPAWLKDDSGV